MLLLAIAAILPATAVTAVSVDGHPDPVTLTVGETVTVRWDTAKAGGNVQYRLVRDISGAGRYDPSYPNTRFTTILDGGAGDSDPTPGKIIWSFTVDATIPAGRYVLQLQDFADNSMIISPVWTVVPGPEAQAISGRVAILSDANPAGTAPADAVIWAGTDFQTLVASATVRPDGSYTLPLPPGTYVLFAEWLGNLRSQRQVVRLAAGQQQSGADLLLLQGQEVSGTVRASGQPVADALVQATAANGRTVATRTLADGTYVLVLPAGQYQIMAPGGSERVMVADGAVDGVDFPAPTPGPTPAIGTIVTVAGNGASTFGGDGRPSGTARLPNPGGLALDAAGNLYIADNVLNRVRKVDAKTGIITTVAGSRAIDAIRFLTPQGNTGVFSGDGGPAVAAMLDTPQHIAVDAAGNLYISDLNNYRVRKVDARTGIITTVAGSGPTGSPTVGAFAGDGGPAAEARLNRPQGIALDAAGSLYIADQTNQRVRKVDVGGVITTVAGGGTAALADGAKATEVAFSFPREVAVDAAGNLFVGDSNNRIVKVSPAGIVSLVAGNGTAGFSGDGGPATAAQYNAAFPRMALDRAGNLYFPDILNERVRKVSADGIISTVAGTGQRGFSGDGGAATEARLAGPGAVVIDAAGNLYIADGANRRIRKVFGVAAPGLLAGRPFP
jgi:sugar lactone lactonase YvrE